MADADKRAIYERKQDGFRVGPATVEEMDKLAGFEEGEWDELPPFEPVEWTPPADDPENDTDFTPPPQTQPDPPNTPGVPADSGPQDQPLELDQPVDDK